MISLDGSGHNCFALGDLEKREVGDTDVLESSPCKGGRVVALTAPEHDVDACSCETLVEPQKPAPRRTSWCCQNGTDSILVGGTERIEFWPERRSSQKDRVKSTGSELSPPVKNSARTSTGPG